jgi:hypothetical protein
LWINHELDISAGALALASTSIAPAAVHLSPIVELFGSAPEVLTDAISALLKAAPAQRFPWPAVTVRLRAPLVRYRVLPWQNGLYKASDRENYARVLLRNQFEVPAIRPRVVAGKYGQPFLAAAIEEQLYQGVLKGIENAGFRLSCVEPLLVSVCRRFRPGSGVSELDYLLLLMEPEFATCLFFCKGSWINVITLSCAADADLEGILNQAATLCDIALPSLVFVCASGGPVPRFPNERSRSFKWLGHISTSLRRDARHPLQGE